MATTPVLSAVSPANPLSAPADGLRYPLSFNLRIIYSRLGEMAIASDIAAALARAGVAGTIAAPPTPAGERYGRLSFDLVVPDQTTMDALYTELSKLPTVKMAL